MKRKNLLRLAAAATALTLALSPAVSAMTVEEARRLLRDNYIDPIPEEILALPTIKEITDALGDPYTYYMSAEEYDDFQSDINDTTVVGIGVMVEKMATGLRVMQVAPNSPAEGAGIRTGDRIVGVDGRFIQEVGSPDALAELITGEEGTGLVITLDRDGTELEYAMIRAKVVFPVVLGELTDGHIGWIEVSSFGEHTGEYIETYIQENDEAADCWVVDVRGNPGGYATAVIQAASKFLGNQIVAYVMDNEGDYSHWRLSPFPVEIPGKTDEPVIVLTDGASASASELFAAAVRDYDHALLIGTQTFGKGVAQNVFPQEDGSAIKITTNRYYSPRWVTPDKSGVTPHLVVDPNLADEVAKLLCGMEGTGRDVLVLELVGQTWYIHREQALSEAYAPAFAELLSALSPGVPLTLDGEPVTPAEAAEAWGADYESRWFSDVETSPYADQINTLAALGMVRGDGTGNFNPRGQLSRAELAAFLTQAIGYWCWASQGPAPYGDVDQSDWFSTPADVLYHLGIMTGDEAGDFRPWDVLDYQQFLTVLLRAGIWTDATLEERMETGMEEGQDDPALERFAPWARAAAWVAAGDLAWEGGYQGEYGLLLAPLEEVEPTGIITREETAAMLYNLLTYSGIVAVAQQ